MYKIIGADGREYGPATLEQMRQWIREGRVNAQTSVLRAGGDWRPASEMPELAAAFFAPSPPTPAPLPPRGVSPIQDEVRGPAVFMIVVAALDIIGGFVAMLATLFNITLSELPGLPRHNVDFQREFSLFFSFPTQAIGQVMSIVCLIGAIQMLRLRAYGLALTAAILMILSCGGCCCFLNLGAGIWALVVLSKPEVRAAFQ